MTIKFFNSLIHLKMIQKLLIVVLSGAISVVKLEWLVTYHQCFVAFHSIRALRIRRVMKAANVVLLEC